MDIFDLRYNQTNSCLENEDLCIDIWAHDNERLGEHISKSKLIFNQIINEEVFLDFYNHFHKQKYLDITYEDFWNYLNKMVEFHDIGKISFNFQVNRVQNLDIIPLLERHGLYDCVDQIDADHSFVSSLLYATYLIKDLETKNSSLFDNIILLLLPYIIYGHHTSIKDILSESEFSYDPKSDQTFYLFSYFLFGEDPEDERKFQDYLYSFLKDNNDPAISFFYSYFYSLLVTADVIASSYANKDVKTVRKCLANWNNRIEDTTKGFMNQKFYELNYNNESKNITFDDLLSEEKLKVLTNINDLRTEMLKEASLNLIQRLKSNNESKIFYLNLPTGGGKTNTSMKLALDLLDYTSANRIIYAMPFINIIEQNYDVIKGNFGLNEEKNEIRKIYSASESIFHKISDDDKSEIIMKDSFFDYPVICTTFVSLFNSLIKNKKRYKYSLWALTNSVIILDEIQSLPLKNWTSLYYLINELSNNFNIYFIIMSATLPEFDELKINKNIKFDYDTTYLINNPEKYFSHPLFNRTEIKGKIKELEADELSDFHDYFNSILKGNFQRGYKKGLVVLNTIKMSKLTFECLKCMKEEYGFEIDLLNSTIIPSEKRKIIYKINQMQNEDRYILVSTQSIEAGVDVSFDFVVRDFATLDSIEQIQGRCNRGRELNQKFHDESVKGNVHIINIKRKNRYDHRYIYDKEETEVKISKTMEIIQNFPNYRYEHVLEYYNTISTHLNQIQDKDEENFVFMDRNNLEFWNRMRYSDLTDKKYGIQIIQSNMQYSFFVATEIAIPIIKKLPYDNTIESMNPVEFSEIYKNNEEKFVFTSNEINYLKNYENEYDAHIIKNNNIDGSELINCYGKYIKKFENDFSAKKIIQKEFSSILYKFIFQVAGDKHEDLVETQGLRKIGYFYVIPDEMIGEGVNKIYSLKNGFNFDFMEENDVNFI